MATLPQFLAQAGREWAGLSVSVVLIECLLNLSDEISPNVRKGSERSFHSDPIIRGVGNNYKCVTFTEVTHLQKK